MCETASWFGCLHDMVYCATHNTQTADDGDGGRGGGGADAPHVHDHHQVSKQERRMGGVHTKEGAGRVVNNEGMLEIEERQTRKNHERCGHTKRLKEREAAASSKQCHAHQTHHTRIPSKRERVYLSQERETNKHGQQSTRYERTNKSEPHEIKKYQKNGPERKQERGGGQTKSIAACRLSVLSLLPLDLVKARTLICIVLFSTLHKRAVKSLVRDCIV